MRCASLLAANLDADGGEGEAMVARTDFIIGRREDKVFLDVGM